LRTTNTFEAEASVSLRSRNRIVSAAPASAETCRSRVLRERVIALGDAARHLEIDALVVEGLLGDQLQDDVAPLGPAVGVADPDGGEAALQAREVLVDAERHARVDRDQLIDAVAEDEAAVQHGDLRFLDRHEPSVQKDHDRPVTSAKV
jgi:hypothetical protein